ncbi:hypothetical protein BJP34_34370 [Moorena producens PAL-8-15-08-1]|uniref:Iron-containing redox enzyme family protein n=1 Tax=Moorena producens PAL-8-15-08-1 TaxID=1458985 RepID=A0A1D8U230_9CYAN|nr:hypothetical protein [Moorena producens]AOX03844.1 hypothetical protein BJP34_34370 [Moorena producens PAL-8-15-08-1]
MESVTSNSTIDQTQPLIDGKSKQSLTINYPKLACNVNIYPDQIVFYRDGQYFGFETSGLSAETLQTLFVMMDGTRSIEELQELFAPDNPEVIQSILQGLEEQALLDDATPFKVHSGIDTLLELEDFTNDLLENTVEGNLFWKPITSDPVVRYGSGCANTGDCENHGEPVPNAPYGSELPITVLYGFGIEHYHLSCHRWNWDFPVLGCQNYRKVQQLINQLYSQEYGQDQLWLKALNGIGISDQDLKDAIALPETVAIGNALAYWANSEPLVLLSTLGVLKRQAYHHLASYLAACERVNLESGFIDPIRELVNRNLTGESENLIHRIFQDIAHVDQQTRQRLGDQIYLFIEMYNNFYRAIWNYYSCTSDLLRRVSAL